MQQIARVTRPTIDVLRVFLTTADPVWGLRVIRETGRAAGTVYPILERLEDLGWLESEWENDSERSGPRRRLYRLTAPGAAAAQRTCRTFEQRTARQIGLVTP